LSQRRQDDHEVVQRRLSNAPKELHQARHYDYLVVNDDLDEAVKQTECILTAEKLKTMRRDLSSLGITGLTVERRA
jgi:guanylate kinase